MRRLGLAFAILVGLTAAAAAQGCGQGNPNCIVPTAPAGTSNNQAASTAFVQGVASSPIPPVLVAGTATPISPLLTLSALLSGSANADFTSMQILATDQGSNTDTTGSGTNGLAVYQNIVAGAGEGNRTAGLFNLGISTNSLTGTNGLLKFYTAVFGQTYNHGHNLGGTSLTPQGDLYGLAGIAQLESGSTFVNQVVGAELDVSVQTGASVAYKSILSLINVNSDAVKGSTFDAAMTFLTDSTSTGQWGYLISVGRPDGKWPANSSTTFFGTTAPVSGSQVAGYGVDFNNVAFTNFAFRSSGFSVGPGGAVTSGFSATAGFVAASRTGSGQSFLFYNPTGADARIFNGSADAFILNTSGALKLPAYTTAGVIVNDASGNLTALANLSVAKGGTNCGAASGTCLDNIAGFASTGYLFRTGAGAYSFQATGPTTTCTITAGNTYVFTNGVLTTKGSNCT